MEYENLTGGPRQSIQIYDWSVSILYHKPKREWGTSFSLGTCKPQNEYLYKTVLSRRLLRFHKPGDVVYAQTKESFLSRFLNLNGATIS